MKKILYTLIILCLPIIFIGQTNWIGTTDSDWQTSTNWSAGIPDASDNVTILNSASNFPVIDDGATAALTNNLTIESTANIIIAPTGRLTVSGSLTNNAGTSGIVIQSTSSGTGSLIFSTTSVSGTVNMFLEGTKWHYVSAQVDGISYTDFNTLNFKYWDESMEWAGGSNSDPWKDFTTTLVNGQGYANYEDENTTTLSGVMHQGTYNIPVTKSSTNGNQGWNLIGNPYTSPIDWDLVDLTGSNLNNAIYFYNGITYTSYVSGAGSATQYIPQGQGFFVNCNNTSGGTLSLNNNDRVHNSQSFWKGSKPTSGMIKLIAQGNGLYDETLIRFMEGATDEFDGSYDAYKLISTNPNVPQIYSLNNAKSTIFSINSLPEITGEITIPLGFLVTTPGSYSISPSEMSIDAEYIYLEDGLTSSVIDLVKYPTYIFDFDDGVANEDRFLLRILPKTTKINSISDPGFHIYPNPSNGIVNLITDNNEPFTIDVYNLSGQKVFSENYNSGKSKVSFNLSDLPNGIYNVKVNLDERTDFKKLILMK